jgi:hypothetical protein
MSNLQLEYTLDEMLATDAVAEPLVADGVRCHGGYRSDGAYVSPRTKNRVPAIEAWQQSHREQFGTEILDAPIDLWPEPFPNVAQTKYLLREGVPLPTITSLTRIGTVEGFGGLIRSVHPGDLQRFFDESIKGTAVEHLDRGLFEAHARDEAGHEEQAGHNKMWFAARDIAFEHPVTEDETTTMMERMGITSLGGQNVRPPALEPLVPRIDFALEMMLRRMIGLLFIEISAFHTFRWAEAVLSDTELVAGDGQAAELVRCIRADETPHVDYLRTALTEMRDRTFVDTEGKHVAGSEVITTIWDNALRLSLGENRKNFVKTARGELDYALEGNRRRAQILEGFEALGTKEQAVA